VILSRKCGEAKDRNESKADLFGLPKNIPWNDR
jgi:hypothetical protein